MKGNLDLAAQSFWDSKGGEALSKHQTELEALAASENGQKVKSLFEADPNIQNALNSGDMTALGGALSRILQTEEGKNLADSLSKLMR